MMPAGPGKALCCIKSGRTFPTGEPGQRAVTMRERSLQEDIWRCFHPPRRPIPAGKSCSAAPSHASGPGLACGPTCNGRRISGRWNSRL